MLSLKDFKPRLYQETILHTCARKNTLVVLPTGLGKTAISLLLAIKRLNAYPTSKILFLAPTKPLVEQHMETFKRFLEIDEKDMIVLTGEIAPKKRELLWDKATIIFSTPQGLSNDIVNSKVHLEDVSCLILDEIHRGVGDYDYVWICKQYHKKSKFPRILGLTASPGSNMDQILEVCKNAKIEEIEVRMHEDPDVKPYVQEIDLEYVTIELPEELLSIKKFLDASFKSKIETLKTLGYFSGRKNNVSRTDLLGVQGDLHRRIASGEKDFSMWKAISVTAEAIKVQHAITLLETQGILSLHKYLKKLFEEAEKTKTKATKNLVKDLNFKSAFVKTEHLSQEQIEHPKLEKLKEIVKDHLRQKPNFKLIVFNNYRDCAYNLVNKLNEMQDIEAKLFVGQMKKGNTGLKQKEQIAMLEEFRQGKFNCLVSSSVGEEGLDIPAVDLVVFYEPVPSAIRKIQRVGRTGRLEKGKVKILVTKNTIDEAYRWSAHHKERKMYDALFQLKNKLHLKQESQPTLSKFNEESNVNVLADTREYHSGIVKQMIDNGVNVKVQRLPAADFILSDKVGVERKTVEDFVSSLIDQRLLQQLKSLKTNFERPLLVIEGTEDIYSVRKVHPNAIRGMLATIAVSYNIPLLYTKNPQDTAGLLLAIAKREQKEGCKSFGIRSEKKPLTTKEQQHFIIESLPYVGPQLAQSLLKHFGTVKGIINADLHNLKKVEKVGLKKAEEIKRIIDEKYPTDIS